MFEKKEPQIFEENKKEGYSEEELREMIKMEIEISGRDNEKENGVMKISEGLRDEIVAYLHNNAEIKGLKEGEKPLLYFFNGTLYLTALENKPLAWLIEDEEIINKIEELIF